MAENRTIGGMSEILKRKGDTLKKKTCVFCKTKFIPDNIERVVCSWECKIKKENQRIGLKIGRDQLGSLSELSVCADLIEKGFCVFRSVCLNGPFDLVGFRNGSILKIEVKSGYRIPTNGKITELKHYHHEHDVIAVYLPEEKRVVYFPALEENNGH